MLKSLFILAATCLLVYAIGFTSHVYVEEKMKDACINNLKDIVPGFSYTTNKIIPFVLITDIQADLKAEKISTIRTYNLCFFGLYSKRISK